MKLEVVSWMEEHRERLDCSVWVPCFSTCSMHFKPGWGAGGSARTAVCRFSKTKSQDGRRRFCSVGPLLCNANLLVVKGLVTVASAKTLYTNYHFNLENQK